MFVTRDISETPGTVSPQTGGRLGWSTDFRAPGPTVLRGLGGRGTLSPGALGPAGVGGWQEPDAEGGPGLPGAGRQVLLCGHRVLGASGSFLFFLRRGSDTLSTPC